TTLFRSRRHEARAAMAAQQEHLERSTAQQDHRRCLADRAHSAAPAVACAPAGPASIDRLAKRSAIRRFAALTGTVVSREPHFAAHRLVAQAEALLDQPL